ncbi:MAG: DUF6151 family protein [Pseudomonadota bacterium]
MSKDVALECACGAVKAVARGISPERVNHVICGCDSCQAFARQLGRAEGILDEGGGTRIFQMSPKHLEIQQGADRLSCMRLTPKGVLRWYAECCRTPLGNTLPTAAAPFIGVICGGHTTFDNAAAAIGPLRATVQMPDRAKNTKGFAMVVAMFGLLTKMLSWRLAGDKKRSPLFDAQTGAPIAPPRMLNEEEYSALTAQNVKA